MEISIDEINGVTTMDNIEDWDSLRHIALMSRIMEMFKVNLDYEETIKMTSFFEINRVLREKGVLF